jgi:hypothetical protein
VVLIESIKLSDLFHKEGGMEKTFIDALSRLNAQRDVKSIRFLEYILTKYFNKNRFLMPVKEAMPFLERHDREQLATILREAF